MTEAERDLEAAHDAGTDYEFPYNDVCRRCREYYSQCTCAPVKTKQPHNARKNKRPRRATR